MSRSPEEVFAHHVSALNSGDIEDILTDYSEDVVLITPGRTYRGHDGVREAVQRLLAYLPGGIFEPQTFVFEDDVLLEEWSATSDSAKATQGVDTYIFSGDKIRAQTVRFTLEVREQGQNESQRDRAPTKSP